VTLRTLLGVFVIAIACAGCVPFKSWDLPSVEGNVRDEASRVPLQGVRIVVVSKDDAKERSEATTDTQGHFTITEVTHTVWMPPLPFDPVVPDCLVQVPAPGYAGRTLDYYEVLRTQRGQTGGKYLTIDIKHE
jgi:hypothetical protein